jgi:hypothetical protein
MCLGAWNAAKFDKTVLQAETNTPSSDNGYVIIYTFYPTK